MIEFYLTENGGFLKDHDNGAGFVPCGTIGIDALLRSATPVAELRAAAGAESRYGSAQELLQAEQAVSLVAGQEVWAAGVTYYRSRSARMEESEKAGGGTFYDRVYEASRPELFYKGSARTTVAHGGEVRIRKDSAWNVPEPELVLVINGSGNIIGYTAGNDMSSRDIEGENPLYLPQAKVYDGSCALGPGIVFMTTEQPSDILVPTLPIDLEIRREGKPAFTGSTTLAELKRSPDELVGYLLRDQTFPSGSFLMTGTGIVPDDTFTLHAGDEISITIGALPALVNRVAAPVSDATASVASSSQE